MRSAGKPLGKVANFRACNAGSSPVALVSEPGTRRIARGVSFRSPFHLPKTENGQDADSRAKAGGSSRVTRFACDLTKPRAEAVGFTPASARMFPTGTTKLLVRQSSGEQTLPSITIT